MAPIMVPGLIVGGAASGLHCRVRLPIRYKVAIAAMVVMVGDLVVILGEIVEGGVEIVELLIGWRWRRYDAKWGM